MPKKSSNKETIKSVDAIRHTDDKRKNIPTIEYRPMVSDDQQSPVPVKYPRNTDLDPQLVWRGKDEQDWSDLVVHAPPLYIQEKVHPKVLIDDLIRMAGDRESAKATDKKSSGKGEYTQLSLFDDFNGVPDGDAKTEFYQHDQHWSNRMILGDSLEFLYDKPYEDKKKVRVAGPFTVESLSPHRMLGIDENDELIDPTKVKENRGEAQSFAEMILENLRTAGVQQTSKEDRINFISLVPWPGEMVCAEGIYREQDADRRAAIMIGPEFGTVQRSDLVLAAREAGDAGFDVLIACAFNYDAMSTEFKKLGRIPVLKARMNADLHMAEDLKNTGKGNLFVIFGEPDVELVSGEWLVTSGGRMVASYERVKKLSGLGSLEEINRLGRSDLSRFQSVSAGGEVWASESDKASDGIDTVEHRRGGRKERNGGISKLSEHGERLVGGSGDTVDNRSEVGDDRSARGRGSDGSNGGDQPHARWVKEVAAIQELVAGDFPLSLATSHYAQVTVHGVDVFHPNTGEVRSDGPDGIACWFIDTDYNEESFFVRHAYFLGQNDPYTALKTTLKAEVDADAWSSLHSDTSRPFSKPSSGRIAVKVINHLGDEVMKVFRV